MRAKVRIGIQAVNRLLHSSVHLRQRTPAARHLDGVHAITRGLPLDGVGLVTGFFPMSIRRIVGANGVLCETDLVHQRRFGYGETPWALKLEDAEYRTGGESCDAF